MISKQKQIYELRKAVVDELELRTVKERMISTLKNKNQYASGKLESVIAEMKYRKAVKVTKTAFDPVTGLMYKATVNFTFDFTGAGYAKFLDVVPYSDIKYNSVGKGIPNLISWIESKKPAYWNTQVDLSSKTKIKRFAHAIMTAQKKRGGVKNKSNFITFTRSNITTAINKASERFVNYLSDELYLEIKRQIFVR
jgi:hypothetical protein